MLSPYLDFTESARDWWKPELKLALVVSQEIKVGLKSRWKACVRLRSRYKIPYSSPKWPGCRPASSRSKTRLCASRPPWPPDPQDSSSCPHMVSSKQECSLSKSRSTEVRTPKFRKV